MKFQDILIVLSLVAIFLWLDKILSANKNSVGVNNSVEVNDTVYIKGLGDFNQLDLIKSKEILEDEFGVVCKIDGAISTDKDFYTKDGDYLEETKTFNKLRSTNKVVYITNELLFDDETDKKLKGSTSNKTMIVRTKTLKKTLLHEFGHSLGLHHCDDKKCLMAIHNIHETNYEFCNNCSKKLNR
jgi:hypothetical protein